MSLERRQDDIKQEVILVKSLTEDDWIVVMSFLDVKDAVRLWIGICLQKQGIGRQHMVWEPVIGRLLGERTLDDVALRLNMYSEGKTVREYGLDIIASLFMTRRCSRSGCLRTFCEKENFADSCAYHPGRMKRQFLSCCRGKNFRVPGCKKSYHDAHYFNLLMAPRIETDNSTDNEKEKRKLLPLLSPSPSLCVDIQTNNKAMTLHENDTTSVKLPTIII
jgi:hypothetical protein